MPAELFRSVVVRRPSRRRFGVVPLSVAFHVALLIAVVTIPLIAIDSRLPVPPIRLHAELASTPVIVVPTAPPPRSARPPLVVGPPVVPLAAPNGIGIEIARSEVPPAIADLSIGTLAGTNIGTVPVEVEPLPPPPPRPAAPVLVGGDIAPPRRTHYVSPVYPEIAMKARIQGTVEIQAIISTTGRVEDAQVTRSIPLLDDAALSAVRQWVFTPTRLNGVAVPVIMTVKVDFKLQ